MPLPQLDPSPRGGGNRDHTPAGTQPHWPIAATAALLCSLIGFSGDAPSRMPRSDWLFLGSDWTETRGGQETSMRYGGTIWVTSETQPHFNKRPGSRDMAAASVVSVLLVATERNQWQPVQSPLLLLPLPLPKQRWVVGRLCFCPGVGAWGVGRPEL